MSKIVIETHNEQAIKEESAMLIVDKQNILVVTVAIMFVIGFVIMSMLQIYRWQPLDIIKAYEDIQDNFNRWQSVLVDYQQLESNKISGLVPYMEDYRNFTCVDYGSFYIAIKFDTYTYSDNNLLLPIAVRRGDGDAWLVTKSATNDPAAYQQCLYLISERSDNTITCGVDMYNKLGYGGYLNSGHWCNLARDNLYQAYQIIT